MAELQFEPQVRQLLEKLPLLRDWQDHASDDGGRRRAFVIEFAGLPKAGKSTAIEDVRHFFSHGHKDKSAPRHSDSARYKYRVHTPAEGVSLRTPSDLKDDQLDFNTWAGAYAVQELLQAYHDVKNDLVVLDRGPWDAGCWLTYHESLLKDRSHAAGIDQKVAFFQLDDWMTRADLHVLLLVEPDRARERERSHRLVDHGGFSSNRAGMEAMYKIYSERFEALTRLKAQSCPHVGSLGALKIDTTDLARQAVSIEIIAAAFHVLQAKIASSRKKFRFNDEWLRDRVERYVPKVRGGRATLDFLPDFVKRANELSDDRRDVLKRLIEEARAPEVPLLNARAAPAESVSAIQSELEALMRKASGE